jgi:hypothetical protein
MSFDDRHDDEQDELLLGSQRAPHFFESSEARIRAQQKEIIARSKKRRLFRCSTYGRMWCIRSCTKKRIVWSTAIILMAVVMIGAFTYSVNYLQNELREGNVKGRCEKTHCSMKANPRQEYIENTYLDTCCCNITFTPFGDDNNDKNSTHLEICNLNQNEFCANQSNYHHRRTSNDEICWLRPNQELLSFNPNFWIINLIIDILIMFVVLIAFAIMKRCTPNVNISLLPPKLALAATLMEKEQNLNV